jgi:hypothetical protein
MKIELSEDQIDLLIEALDCLTEAAVQEARYTTDMEILRSDEQRMAQAESMIEHLSREAGRKRPS